MTTPIAQGPVDVNVRVGCGSCAHRDKTGHCRSDKLDEGYGQSDETKADMLIYDYNEGGGGFWVGEKFGCIHHAPSAEYASRNTTAMLGAWISADDALPEPKVQCLTLTSDGLYQIRKMNAHKFSEFFGNKVTYWMPLPEAPNEPVQRQP